MYYPLYWIAGSVVASVPATMTFRSVCRFIRKGELVGHLRDLHNQVGSKAEDGVVQPELPSNVIDPRSLL